MCAVYSFSLGEYFQIVLVGWLVFSLLFYILCDCMEVVIMQKSLTNHYQLAFYSLILFGSHYGLRSCLELFKDQSFYILYWLEFEWGNSSEPFLSLIFNQILVCNYCFDDSIYFFGTEVFYLPVSLNVFLPLRKSPVQAPPKSTILYRIPSMTP